MHPFALSRTDTPAHAVAAHARDPQLAFIAGGTDLLGLIKDRAAAPERLLDINGLSSLSRIDLGPDGRLHIGALARMSDVAAHRDVREQFPVIAEALLFSASGQLRNMASIGGNIMQRTPPTFPLRLPRSMLMSSFWVRPENGRSRSRTFTACRGTRRTAIPRSSAGS